MSPRDRLPNRRRSETVDITHNGHILMLTVGFYDDGRMGEVFITAAKIGSDLEATTRDVAIQISLALQNGTSLEELNHSLTINPDGTPSSPIGSVVRALIDWPKSETPLSKPNEVVPAALRTFYRWGPRHDRMAARVMQALNLKLPDDRAQIYAETWLRIRPKKLYPDGRASIPEVDAADIGPPLTRKTKTD